MYDYKAKEKNISQMNQYMLVKTLSMFDYENLPETMCKIALEKQLQTEGYAFITEHEGNLYSFTGGLGGQPDVYGNPTEIVITNPALKLNKSLSLQDDGVLITNDDLQLGLIPLYEKYNSLMIENEITMYISSFISRMPMLISAGDDNTKESAEKLLEKVLKGELGVIGENRLFEGIKTQYTTTTGSIDITKMIELNQYMKAGLYNEIGLNANFNMKRERLNSSEVDLNEDNLFPLIDNMLTNRINGIEKLNEKYDLEIYVDFGSSWKREEKEIVIEETEIETEEKVIEAHEMNDEIIEKEIEIEIEKDEEKKEGEENEN